MSVTRCLKCEEAVLIPSGASLKAVVRCPLCDEQFELGEMLDEIPPVLAVVEDPEAVDAQQVKPFSFDVTGQQDDEAVEAEVEDSETIAAEKVGAFDFNTIGQQDDQAVDAEVSEGAGAVDAEVSEASDKVDEQSDDDSETGVAAFQFDNSSPSSGDAATTAYRPASRPKRKGKNPVAEMVKIVGGGALGIAIAIIGIWWVPKIFGAPPKDPFKLGPKVSNVAPWIVPSELHASPQKDDSEGETDDDDNDAGNSGNNRPGPNRGIVLSSSPPNEDIGGQDLLSGSGGGTLGESTWAPPTRDQGKDTAQPRPAVDRSTDDFLGIRNATTTTTKELSNAVNSADVSLTLWDSDLERDAYREDACEKLGQLGLTTSCANQEMEKTQDLLQRTDQLLGELAGNPTKLSAVNAWAAEQLRQDSPELRGVVGAAEVQSIEAVGLLFENRLQLLTEDRQQIVMLTAKDISDLAPPGATVVFAGAIVQDPSVNFGGYVGDDEKVIGCGTYFSLAPVPEKDRSNE